MGSAVPIALFGFPRPFLGLSGPVEAATVISGAVLTAMLSDTVPMHWLMGRSGNIIRPPGSRSDRILCFLMTKKGYERIVAPQIADERAEWIAAVAEGAIWRGRWIKLRLPLLLLQGLGLHSLRSVLEKVIATFKTPGA